MAYNFWRKLKERQLLGRFHLVRGVARNTAPRCYIDYPDARQKDKLAAARGDVPVLFLNANLLKDGVSHRLDCLEPGKGMVHFPLWLKRWFYKELCIEIRTDKGWVPPNNASRNEAWDLLYYCLGVCASPLLRVETLNWAAPPPWAKPWDDNPMIVQPLVDENDAPLGRAQRVDRVVMDIAAQSAAASRGGNLADLGRSMA